MRSRIVRRGLPICIVAVIACLCGLGHGGELPARAPADLVTAAPAVTPERPVTFTRDVAPILFANCATCHRPGEVAPFSLLTYSEAKRHARQLTRVTGDRVMPPWKADAGTEVFRDARRLSDAQIATIRRWVEQGAAEGDAADLPAAPKFTDGWQLGTPDVVLEPDEDFHVPPEGGDVYRCFVFPTHYDDDRYVAAMEVRAGNRAVVHHAMGYVDTSGAARRLDAADPGPGYTAFGGVGFLPAGTLDGWGPGVAPHRLPDGVGMALPRGADVVVQLHYHPDGKPETDRTRIGLYFCRTPVDKRLNMAVALNPGVRIPPGAVGHEERATLTIPQDITLIRIAPHMHLIGKDIAVTATFPDGASRLLVRVPDWDFRWQSVFTFNTPVSLPRGSRLEVVAHYDNSADNPANPSRPPKLVRWGEATTDEMCIAALFYTVDAEHLTQGAAARAFAAPPGAGGDAAAMASPMPGPLGLLGATDPATRERLALRLFDKNGDGKLDAEERAEAMKFIERFRGGLTDEQRAGAERFLERIGGSSEPTTRPGAGPPGVTSR
jgi:mono/diheme cytochrome c family protein